MGALKEILQSVLHSVFSGAKQSPQVIHDSTVESVKSVRSPDRPTRRMAILFILSLVGLIATLAIAAKVYFQHRAEEKARLAELQRIEEERRALEEELRRKNLPPTYQSLGGFSLELREKPGVVRPRNSLGSAEMEIVIACEDPEICEYVKQNIDAARGELLPLFVPTDREKLLSIPGKKAFREEIRDQLNQWLEKRGVKGQIVDVLLPRFIIS